MRFLAAAVFVLAFAISSLAQDSPRTFNGTWNNKRYGTSGTLKCVATPGKDGKWTATFSGTFMAENFSYDVTFDAKAGKSQQDLTGKAEIRNHKYNWTGTIKGDTLTGTYRSNSGYFGDFVLKEAKRR